MSTSNSLKKTVTPAFPIKFEHTCKANVNAEYDPQRFLAAIPCSSALFPTENGIIVTAYEDDTISDAFQKMILHQILSLPVIEGLNRKPLYVLSMVHLMDYLLRAFNESDFKDDLWHTMVRYFTDPASKFCNTKIGDLAGKIDRSLDPAHTIHQDSSLLDAVKFMVDQKAHRLLVVDDHGSMVNLLTQSRVVQALHPVLDTIPRISSTIAELGIGSSPVMSIFDSKPAYEAFKLMQVSGVTALAVIDQNGVLVGNISVSDLKLIGYDVRYWDLLGKSIKEYLDRVTARPDVRVKSYALAFQPDRDKAPVVVKCRPFHTIAFAIRLMSFYRVHRLYIVDDANKPTGIITLTDVLRELIQTERK